MAGGGLALRLDLRSPEHKLVVDGAQVLEVVLLEADEPLEVGLARQRAAEAVHDVLPVLLLFDKEHVEHFLVAPAAVVRRLVTFSPVEPIARRTCHMLHTERSVFKLYYSTDKKKRKKFCSCYNFRTLS